MRLLVLAWTVAVLVFGGVSAAWAQDEVGGAADIELGASQPTDIELGAGTGTSRPRQNVSSGGGGGGNPRLALQLRLNAVNVLEVSNVVDNRVLDSTAVPLVTPGVRLLDSKLFIGVGLGFNGVSSEDEDGDEMSQSGFTVSPLGSYDLLVDDSAALSLLGWLNLSSLSETEVCDSDGTCVDLETDVFAWGLNLGVGVRGFISPGLAIGGEFGWGFLSASADAGGDVFGHGLFGNLLFEASIGI